MTISLNWLEDYLDLPYPPERIAEMLTSLGLEVEGQEVWESVPGSLKGVVVGKVLSCGKHPGADRLSLTSVDIGQAEPVQIVCGAPNVAAGQTVLVATVGTTLHPIGAEKPLLISKGKIRGELSMGMICAEDELGIGKSHAGILVLDREYAPGTPASQVIPIVEDVVFEIGLTPNRSDATSHRGVAIDLRAYLMAHEGYEKPLKSKKNSAPPISTSFQTECSVEVLAKAAAPRYAGAFLENLKVGPSPAWLKNRLEALGVRSINNVVDATNYILHDLGQPLHAFDLDKLATPGIRVVTLPQNTPFVTLDGVERKLDAEDLMICDGADQPLCIAGVFGGQGSGVTESTTRIFLEAAVFDPRSIRRSATRHNLHTDAARIFEKGVDASQTLLALHAATQLLAEVAGASVVGPVIDIIGQPLQAAEVSLSLDRLRTLTGVQAELSELSAILQSLDFQVTEYDETNKLLQLKVPSSRADVTREADVVEEFLRVYGYDRVPLPTRISLSPAVQSYPSAHQLRRRGTEYLLGQGLHEAMGLSLVPSKIYETLEPAQVEHLVRIHNTSTIELDAMRVNLVPTGLQAITYNQNRQRLDLQFFEFGKGYLRSAAGQPTEYEQLAIWATGARYGEHWSESARKTTQYAHVRGLAEGVVASLGIQLSDEAESEGQGYFAFAQNLLLDGEVVARVGRVSAEYVKYFDCKSSEIYLALVEWEILARAAKRLQTGAAMKVKELSRFPLVRRDLALLVDQSVRFSDIVELARRPAGSICKSIDLFDVFEDEAKLGAGKRSYAIRFVFERTDRTLNDKEVDKAMAAVTTILDEQPAIQVRR